MLPLNQIFRLVSAGNDRECGKTEFHLIPGLIITDVIMLVKDDLVVFEIVKNDERTSHIPIVIIVAKTNTGGKLESPEHGADVYLAEPFHEEELLLHIKKVLELRQHLQHHYLFVGGLHNDKAARKETPPVSVIENTFVQKARSIVEDHMNDLDFDVGQFCRALTLSHPQVHRKLSALTGLSANKFIRSIRLNKAKSLLIDPEMSITAVAFDSGFSDSSYFGKIFKQEFGLTPLEWREHNGDAGHKSNHST